MNSAWQTILGTAIVVSATLAGAAILLQGGGTPNQSGAEPQPAASIAAADADTLPGATSSNDPAVRYAQAVMEGRCDVVLSMVAWVEERLSRARLEPGVDMSRVRQELCDKMLHRSERGAILRNEGIGDQYIFAPSAEITVLGHDEGRGDLHAPVARCTWLRVTYPEPGSLLRDARGRPIQSIEVGVNLSHNGQVLKAGIIGNLEIDHASVRYHR